MFGTSLVCRHCGDELTAAGPVPVGDDYPRPYEHADGREVAGDGHTAAPLDPELSGSVTALRAKPTPAQLGIGLAAQEWERSGSGDGSIEVAFPLSEAWERGDWVLMRVAGDPHGRVLVFDRNEWECFLDGARNGEFDDAAEAAPAVT